MGSSVTRPLSLTVDWSKHISCPLFVNLNISLDPHVRFYEMAESRMKNATMAPDSQLIFKSSRKHQRSFKGSISLYELDGKHDGLV